MSALRSRPDPHVDVAVLGGGPAGSTAARMLAHWGHDVALLTRPAPGPPLAESLTPSCAKVLERVGVLEALNRGEFVRSTGHTVRWGNAEPRIERFQNGELGWQISRDDLDRVLLREAGRAGAHLHRRASVRAVVPTEDGTLRIAYDERGHTRHLRARWVIDCTGRSGLMSRAGSGRVAMGLRMMAIVGLWERRPHWGLADESHTHVESYAGGWAWSVPYSRTRRQVTVMLDPSRTDIARGHRLRMTYREELARTTMIRGMTAHAKFLGSPWARDASSYESARPAVERVLLAGDAASFVDPLSSFGVKKAMASAWLVAVVVNTVLRDSSMESAALDLLDTRERAMATVLRRDLDDLARDAAAAHPDGFWSDRTARDAVDVAGDPDLAALRADNDVRAAFETIRTRPTLGLRPVSNLQREARPVVVADRVVLADHLVVPAFPSGIRFIRSVDLLALADLTREYDDVATLFEAYCRANAPVPIEDLLGALAVLAGKGVLSFVR